jgi:hypothetical protein
MHRSPELYGNCFGVFKLLVIVLNRYLILGKISYNVLVVKSFMFIDNSLYS